MTALDGQHSAMVRVADYEEGTDIFTLTAVGFTEEDQVEFPTYSRAAPDFDDFEVPGLLLPALIGEFGEPSELLDRAFVVQLPK